jgi:hypothetical protein
VDLTPELLLDLRARAVVVAVQIIGAGHHPPGDEIPKFVEACRLYLETGKFDAEAA